MEIKTLGQVFTPEFIVDEMINLISIKEPNLVLEPSSGSGNFYYKLIEKYKNVIGVEIDESVAHKNAVIKSYFETNYHPDVIIGNPPYVDFKNIINKPNKTSLFQKTEFISLFFRKSFIWFKRRRGVNLNYPSFNFHNFKFKSFKQNYLWKLLNHFF